MIAVNSEKTLIILVGPKGAGKSHIGNLISELFEASFLQIEKIWQDMQREYGDTFSQAYMEEGLRRNLQAISYKLLKHDVVIIETTGVFEQFDAYLDSLKTMAKVFLVNVQSPIANCFTRIKNRDQSVHVDISDEMIGSINTKAETVVMDWDMVIVNNPFVSREALQDIFLPFLKLRICQ